MGAVFRGFIVITGLIWVAGFMPGAPQSDLWRLQDFGDALFAGSPVLSQMRERGQARLAHGPLALFDDDPLSLQQAAQHTRASLSEVE